MKNDHEKQFLKILIEGAPTKIKILYSNNDVLALDKPEGILIDAYPWYPDVGSIVLGLRQQMAQGLLEKCHLESTYAVYALEPEVTGVALIASNKHSSSYLRNEFGSGKLLFRFIFLTKSGLDTSFVECDLPIAKHYTENRAVISNRTGKKCKTWFRLVEAQGEYQVWEAQTTYLRMHQIRIHAMESGIAIVGDHLYGEMEQDDSFCSNRSSTEYSVIDLPLSEGICLHLSSVEWGDEDKKICIHSPLPKKMKRLFEKLKIVQI